MPSEGQPRALKSTHCKVSCNARSSLIITSHNCPRIATPFVPKLQLGACGSPCWEALAPPLQALDVSRSVEFDFATSMRAGMYIQKCLQLGASFRKKQTPVHAHRCICSQSYPTRTKESIKRLSTIQVTTIVPGGRRVMNHWECKNSTASGGRRLSRAVEERTSLLPQRMHGVFWQMDSAMG